MLRVSKLCNAETAAVSVKS